MQVGVLDRFLSRRVEIEAHPKCVGRVLFTQHGSDPIDQKPARPLLALGEVEVVGNVPLRKDGRVARRDGIRRGNGGGLGRF